MSVSSYPIRMTGVLTNRKIWRQIHTGGHREDEGRDLSDGPRNWRWPARHQKLGKGHGEVSPPQPSEGNNPADTEITDIWPPELRQKHFLLSLKLPSWCQSKPSQRMQWLCWRGRESFPTMLVLPPEMVLDPQSFGGELCRTAVGVQCSHTGGLGPSCASHAQISLPSSPAAHQTFLWASLPVLCRLLKLSVLS